MVDELFPPLIKSGEIALIAGRSGMGRTAVALGIAASYCTQYSEKVCFLASNDSEYSLRMRLAYGYGFKGKISGFTYGNNPGEIGIWRSSLGFSLEDIKASYICYKLLILDDLEISSHSSMRNRFPDVKMLRKLKRIAEESKTAIVVVSKLTRKPEKREDHVPRISDIPLPNKTLKYVDRMLLPFRESYYKTTYDNGDHCEESSAFCISIDMHNSNTSKSIPLVWHLDTLAFSRA